MKQTKYLWALLLIAVIFTITACGSNPPKDENRIMGEADLDDLENILPGEEPVPDAETGVLEMEKNGDDDSGIQPKNYHLRIYLVTKDGDYLFPVTFAEKTSTPALAALETLISLRPPDFADNPIPPEIEIDSLFVEGGTADLSLEATEPVNLGAWYERLMAEAIVRTLTQFNNVDNVLLSEAQGSHPIFKHIDITVPLSCSENINFENPPMTLGSTLLHLWFPDSQAMFMVPVSRAVPATKEVARASVNALIQGPTAGSNLTGVFPADLILQDIYIQGGTCYVDFNKTFAVGDIQESMAFYILAVTLNNFSSIDRVIVTVNGEPIGDSMSGYTTEERPLEQTQLKVNPLSTYEEFLTE